MHKFLNLQCLLLNSDEYILSPKFVNNSNVPQNLMIDFFKYALGVAIEIGVYGICMENACDFMVSFLKSDSNFDGSISITYSSIGSIGQDIVTAWDEKGPLININKNPGYGAEIEMQYATSFVRRVHQAAEILPHQELFEKAGNLIHELCLNSYDSHESHSLIGSSATLVDRNHLLHVLRKCTSLKSLTLAATTFPGYSETSTTNNENAVNSSVVRVSISAGDIPRENSLLSELSILLPSLKYLELEYPAFLSSANYIDVQSTTIFISFTSFNTLHLNYDKDCYDWYHLKVETANNDGRTRYYILDRNISVTIECHHQEYYTSSSQKKNGLSIQIVCKLEYSNVKK